MPNALGLEHAAIPQQRIEDPGEAAGEGEEPLWRAVNEVNLPPHFHTFPSLPPGVLDRHTGLTRRAAFFTVVSGFQMNLVNILAAVIGAAVLEGYPNVRIAFGESGIGWIPYALDRMDFEWEDRFRDLGLAMKPSDYWRRQCKGTFQFDRIGTKLIEDMGGVEALMWGSDYRHGDGVWPESSRSSSAISPPTSPARSSARTRAASMA
jgi:predicted TIM-barrel fold metal-dependent hydrolase